MTSLLCNRPHSQTPRVYTTARPPGFVNTGAAFLIGILGSVISSLVQEGMDRFGRRYVDDTLDVFACHGVGEF